MDATKEELIKKQAAFVVAKELVENNTLSDRATMNMAAIYAIDALVMECHRKLELFDKQDGIVPVGE